jgi:hypothetical protein
MTTTHVVGHTPGPWGVTTNNGIPAVGSDTEEGGLICDLLASNFSNMEANARLIAAAPEMLEALRTALVHLPGLVHPADVKQIRDAIAKAEGRT